MKLSVFAKLRQDSIIAFFKERGITSLSVFGSYARGEQKKESDLDWLFSL